MYGHEHNCLDIFGKGWPEKISKEDSRGGDWVGRKKMLMSGYRFNLCFENTYAKNYITEKIWDSISNYCLPIYYGQNGIYDLFPQESFIDYSQINDPEELFSFIKCMDSEEYVERMNKCIEVYLKYHKQPLGYFEEQRELILLGICDKIREVCK